MGMSAAPTAPPASVTTVAPIMMITSPAAAIGVSPGRICRSSGRINPIPPSTSHTPMKRMKSPKPEQHDAHVLTHAEIKAILATCDDGTDFESRRDAALIRLMIDCGARRAEVADLLAVIGQRAEVDPKRRIACLRMHGAALRDEREHGGGSERANGQSLHVYSAYALSSAAIGSAAWFPRRSSA